MRKKKQSNTLAQIYKELEELYFLNKIRQESLQNCFEEDKDYGHIFCLDTIYNNKFDKILNNLKTFVA